MNSTQTQWVQGSLVGLTSSPICVPPPLSGGVSRGSSALVPGLRRRGPIGEQRSTARSFLWIPLFFLCFVLECMPS